MSRLESLSRVSLIALGTIATVFALDQVESIFAPLAMALVAGVVLSPVSDAWEKMGFAPVWGALTSLVLSILVMLGVLLVFQPAVSEIVAQAPKVWFDMRQTLLGLRGMIEGFQDATGELTEALAPGGPTQAAPGSPEVALPGVADALMMAPAIAGQLLVFSGALFFFLLSRGQIYTWFAACLSRPTERARTALRLREAERRVSRYFLTITMINACLGVATAVGLQILGLPGAMSWGLVAAVINFVPYLGPVVLLVSLLFAGIAAFDGPAALGPAIVYGLLNGAEGQFITPALIGRHMAINPLLVFLALVFGLWLWGPVGGVVAIPLLLWGLILADTLPECTGVMRAP